MTTSSAAAAGGLLCTEKLSFEPVRMVNIRRGGNGKNEENVQEAPAPVEGRGAAPGAFRILELSNVDQMYEYYNSVALFYDVQSTKQAGSDEGKLSCCDGKNGSGDDLVERLRAALGELLVHYPAAGGRVCYNGAEARLEIQYCLEAPPDAAHTTSDRNGGGGGGGADGGFAGGVPFIGAHATMAFRELGDVSVPHPSQDLLYPFANPSLEHLFTSDAATCKYPPRPVMAMQVTLFTCGGFCLAHTCHHAFLDGHSAATFLQNLCSIARGEGLAVVPDFSISRREVMMPGTPPAPSPRVNHSTVIKALSRENEAAVTGRHVRLVYGTAIAFAFPLAALHALRLRASCSHVLDEPVTQCSRFQALVALLWTARAKSFVASSPASVPLPQMLSLRFPINLRDKGIPGLTQAYIGNAVVHFSISATLQELCERPFHAVVSKLRSAMRGMDLREYVQSQTDYIELKLREGMIPHIDHDCLGLPSLVGLPFYDTDCGWGRPVYCGRPSKQLGQRLIILDHPAAKAWNVLAVFHSQEEQAAFRQEIVEYIVK